MDKDNTVTNLFLLVLLICSVWLFIIPGSEEENKKLWTRLTCVSIWCLLAYYAAGLNKPADWEFLQSVSLFLSIGILLSMNIVIILF